MEVIQEVNINVTITDLENEQERASMDQNEGSREANRVVGSPEVTPTINTSAPVETSQISVPSGNNNIQEDNYPSSSEDPEGVHRPNIRPPEEPPPPYTSDPNPLQYSPRFGGECSLPGYNDISHHANFRPSQDQRLYLLNQHGQMVPVHLPGQIVYDPNTLRNNNHNMSTNGGSTVVSFSLAGQMLAII